MTLKFAVVFGSVRESRMGLRVAKFVQKKLEEKGHEVTLIDPVEYKLEFLNKMYKEYSEGQAPENLQKLSKIFSECDAIIPITAEYNHLPPPALLNLLSHFQKEYHFKPSGIVSYSVGSFAGLRAAVMFRDYLAELGMSAIPTVFPVGKMHMSFNEEGNTTEEGEAYNKRVTKFLDELEWYANALKEARNKSTPY